MDDRIVNVLNELEKKSLLEKSKKVRVSSENRMLAITKETGELINMILQMIEARNILEIGTSVGYSTIWCADAIRQNSGKITTIEKNPEKIERAKINFENAGISDIITIKNGLAMDILEEWNRERFQSKFDFVLIDADKENTTKYFDLVFPLVRENGIIMTDNMLYPEKYREDMRVFSEYLRHNPKVRSITCPIGNGEEITIKLKD